MSLTVFTREKTSKIEKIHGTSVFIWFGKNQLSDFKSGTPEMCTLTCNSNLVLFFFADNGMINKEQFKELMNNFKDKEDDIDRDLWAAFQVNIRIF